MALPTIKIIPPSATFGRTGPPTAETPAAATEPAPAALPTGAPGAGAIDEKRLLVLTYGELLTLLTDPFASTITYAELEWLLLDRLERFRNPSNPFLTANHAARTQVEKLSVRGLQLSKEEKDFALKFGKTWNMDESQVALLWKAYASAFAVQPLKAGKEPGSVSDEQEHMRDFLLFVFEERLNVTRIVAALLRAASNEDDAMHGVANVALGKIMNPYESQMGNILSAFQDRCMISLPSAVLSREHRQFAVLWARQYVQEQIGFLEVLFLANYIQAPSATIVHDIIESIYGARLGSSHDQLNAHLMDDAGQLLIKSLKVAAILLAIGVFNLESLWGLEFTLAEQSGTTLLTKPDTLLSIHEILLRTPSDSSYAPIVLAWSVVLHTLTEAMRDADAIPDVWLPLVRAIAPETEKGPAVVLPDQRMAFEEFTSVALDPSMDVFGAIEEILSLPPFESESERGGALLSPVNALAYRSVLKGLLISIPTVIQLPFLSALDAYLNCVCTLLTRGPAHEVAGLAQQFWEEDMKDPQRSTVLTILAARAPLSFSLLLRLLSALCGNGQNGSDDLTPNFAMASEPTAQEKCADFVWNWFDNRKQFAMVLSASDIGLLWETGPFGWVTKKPMSFPGGGLIEADVIGQILNQGDGQTGVLVSWPVKWSGFHLLLDLLRAHFQRHDPSSYRRRDIQRNTRSPEERRKARTINIDLEEVQVDVGTDETELIGNILDLIAALLRAKPGLAEKFDTLFGPQDKTPHAFLELLLKLLELVFLRTNPRSPPPLRLITPLLTILSSIAYNPSMSIRLSSYVRASSVFATGGAFTRLVSSEQIVGTYTGTLDVLRLVSSLVEDARRHQFATPEKSTHALKADVLQQALTFVFRDMWSTFIGWRYNSMTERLVLAEKMIAIYTTVLEDWALAPVSPASDSPYRQVVYTVVSAFVNNQLYITPLSVILTSAPETIITMAKAKRSTERELLCRIVEGSLRIVRLALPRKEDIQVTGLSTLENAIFSSATDVRRSLRSRPISGLVQLLFDYIVTPYPFSTIQMEATKAVDVLCRSIGNVPSGPSFVGALTDAVETVKRLVDGILQNDMVPLPLRCAVWNLASATINTQQALGSIFLTGSLPTGMSEKARGKQSEKVAAGASVTAVTAAINVLNRWDKLLDDESCLVVAALNFLDICWSHFDEYAMDLEPHRGDAKMWKTLVAIASKDIGPDPAAERFTLHSSVAKAYRSSAHDAIARHSNLLLIKGHAAHLLSLDLMVASSQLTTEELKTSPPNSFKELGLLLRQTATLNDVLSKAMENPYSPTFMTGVARHLKPFVGFDIDMLRSPLSSEDRESGDDYLYPLELVFTKLRGYPLSPTQTAIALKDACALNLNWSLIDRHVALTRSWRALLEAASPWIATQPTLQTALINNIAFVAKAITTETRDGEAMIDVHSTRIALLQAMIGGIGMPTDPSPSAAADLYAIMGNIRNLMVHEHFPPLESFRGRLSPPFHRPLLRVIQWSGRILASRTLVKTRTAQQWTIVSSAMTATLEFLVVALRELLANAMMTPDSEPSPDLELFVTMFDRCTQAELHPVPALWLSLCEDADLIRISIEILALTDIGATNSDPSQKLLHPGYANHVLAFHMALTKAPVAAESLAQAGVLTVYTENCLTPVLERGDVVPKDPDTNGRTLAHEAWCMMLSVTTALLGISSLTAGLLEAKIVMLVQSYGRQLIHTLGWKVEESLSLPMLEEIERTVAFFYTMSARSSSEQDLSSPTWALLSVYSEKALVLLQQLNYAVTHPKHTFSLLEPFSQQERIFFDQDDEAAASRSSTDLIDPVKRPALAALTQRLFLITRDIMSSLTALSRPDAVIRTTETSEWWLPGNVHSPTKSAAVSIDEPASLGTLLELGNVARDTLSAMISLKGNLTPKRPIPACTASCPPFDRALSTSALRETLEMLLLYIAAEVTRGIFDGSGSEYGEAQDEDEDMGETSRGRSKAATGTDPAQRALRGELFSELRELLSKSTALFEKMDGSAKRGSIVLVLTNHVKKRLSNASA